MVPPSASPKYPLRSPIAPVKAPFSWPEQFRINRSFRDSPAVYSDILSVLSAAVLMDNLRKTLLTHTLSPVISTDKSVGAGTALGVVLATTHAGDGCANQAGHIGQQPGLRGTRGYHPGAAPGALSSSVIGAVDELCRPQRNNAANAVAAHIAEVVAKVHHAGVARLVAIAAGVRRQRQHGQQGPACEERVWS